MLRFKGSLRLWNVTGQLVCLFLFISKICHPKMFLVCFQKHFARVLRFILLTKVEKLEKCHFWSVCFKSGCLSFFKLFAGNLATSPFYFLISLHNFLNRHLCQDCTSACLCLSRLNTLPLKCVKFCSCNNRINVLLAFNPDAWRGSNKPLSCIKCQSAAANQNPCLSFFQKLTFIYRALDFSNW